MGSYSACQNQNYQISMTSAEKLKADFETGAGADQFATSGNTYNDGSWYHIMVTNDGSNLRLYIDGVHEAVKPTGGASPESSGTKPVRAGDKSRVTSSGNSFTGEADEVRVWNDDLNAQQVADVHAESSFNSREQILYMPFTSSGTDIDIFGIKKL